MPASTVAVVRDVLELKGMSLPVVLELSRFATASSWDSGLQAQLDLQVRDEQRHFALCRDLLLLCSEPVRSVPLPHVSKYALVMSRAAIAHARPQLLAVATVLCTAVETAAFDLLASNTSDSDSRQLFESLLRDEVEHFRLVSETVGPSLFRGATLRDLVRGYWLLFALGWIAISSWWPALVTDYREAGLDPPRFVAALSKNLAVGLGRCGIWFPHRCFAVVATPWLRLLDWFNRRKSWARRIST